MSFVFEIQVSRSIISLPMLGAGRVTTLLAFAEGSPTVGDSPLVDMMGWDELSMINRQRRLSARVSGWHENEISRPGLEIL